MSHIQRTQPTRSVGVTTTSHRQKQHTAAVHHVMHHLSGCAISGAMLFDVCALAIYFGEHASRRTITRRQKTKMHGASVRWERTLGQNMEEVHKGFANLRMGRLFMFHMRFDMASHRLYRRTGSIDSGSTRARSMVHRISSRRHGLWPCAALTVPTTCL